MKVLFCHDGPIRKGENKEYYGVAHNDETFSRYYTIANNLDVAIRVEEVLSIDAEKELSKITVPNFKVHEIPNISSVEGLVFNRRTAIEKIKNAVKEADYVVVRLHSFIGFIAFDYAKKLKKQCLVELVACPWDAFWNHSFKGKIIAPFVFLKTKNRVKKASHVVYVTNSFLQKRYPTRGKEVNCSNVSLKETNNNILKKRLIKISNMKKENKIIVGTTAAVNVKFKGQQYIIEAIGRMKKNGISNYEYQLVGGGSQTYLKSIAEKFDVVDQVVFLGTMPHSSVFKWLEQIDIYAQPSRQEGLPRALIEAMSMGLPSIGAKTAGIPELLDDQFIFSNTRNNIDEIISRLLSLNHYNLKAQATRNFNEAKKYDKDIINKRRKNFFEEFRENGK